MLKEQLTAVIRYVQIYNGQCTVEESFLDFIVCHDKTGAWMTDVIVSKLEVDGIALSDCRGQGYDNGANMSVMYKGVQAHINQMNEFATFVL